MQRYEMSLVHRIFGALQPVAIVMAGADMALAIFSKKQIIVWQQRRGCRTHVSKNKPGDLLSLVSRMLHAVFKTTVGRFRGLFETLPMDVVEPAVVAAANTSLFHPAEL